MGLKYLDIWTAEKIGAEGELSREAIDGYTAKKLSETVSYAVENSVFYREKYAGLEDFRRLPFTSQEDLRERGMDLLCVRPADISRIVTLDTGGSTGKPKRIYFTEEDQQLTVDFFKNGMQLMAGSNDKVLILMPAKVPGSIGKLLAEGLAGFGAEAVEYGLPAMSFTWDPENGGIEKGCIEANRPEAKKLLDLIEEENITGVVALPTHMAMLAEESRSGQTLDWVLLSAEYVEPEQAEKISTTFGCRIYEHYGMTEMGLGCAVGCGHGEGYHVRESDLYIEIIDPETGEPVKDGEIGEIVFTTLTRKGMPFIRYRTGDFSRWITEECGCGSLLKRLAKVGPRDVVKGYLKGE